MAANICLVPRLQGIGGMVSFQAKLAEGLSRRGITISYDLRGTTPDSILVIGGTRNIHHLWGAKRRGIRIVQRLNGMNWIHRVKNTGASHWMKAEYGNFILRVIRTYLADKIAYQSQFSREWWDRERGKTPCPNVIIHNGVDLSRFVPDEFGGNRNSIRLLLVEGSLLGGYEFGLENAIFLAYELARLVKRNKRVELRIVGKVSDSVRNHWENWLVDRTTGVELKISWLGVIDHPRIPDIYRQADVLFSADINAACPNSVIESLASGTPVIAFDTGALAELLADRGGVLVPYGGDPWKIDRPDISALAVRAQEMIEDLNTFRDSARKRAEQAFDLELMVDRYLDLLLG